MEAEFAVEDFVLVGRISFSLWQIRFMFAFRPLENSFRYPFLIVACNAILFICVETARAETFLIRS